MTIQGRLEQGTCGGSGVVPATFAQATDFTAPEREMYGVHATQAGGALRKLHDAATATRLMLPQLPARDRIVDALGRVADLSMAQQMARATDRRWKAAGNRPMLIPAEIPLPAVGHNGRQKTVEASEDINLLDGGQSRTAYAARENGMPCSRTADFGGWSQTFSPQHDNTAPSAAANQKGAVEFKDLAGVADSKPNKERALPVFTPRSTPNVRLGVHTQGPASTRCPSGSYLIRMPQRSLNP